MKNLIEKIIFFGIKLITFDYLIIRRIIKKHKKDAKLVLDLGCGNGYLSHLFNPKSYLGVEIDEHLVEEARINYPGYNFMAGDITNLSLKRKFDLITVIGVIHHLDNRNFGKALSVISNHLSKTGRVLIVEAIPPISRFNLIGKIIRSHDRGDYVRSLSSYKSRMEKLFTITQAREVKGGIVDYAFFVLYKK